MKCRKAQKDISRAADGELDRRRAARLESHLETCRECRALAEDFRTIIAGAAALAAPEPSDKVWKGVRAGLSARNAIPARERLESARRPAFGLGVPVLRYAGVAALAVVLVASGILVGLRLGRRATPPGMDAGERYTLAKLDEAEQHYQQAIKSLSEAFASQKGALAPQVVELFERNLGVIDATIKACRAAVLAEPDDLQARNYLLAAYTEKVTLLDSALDLQKQDREAVSKAKKIL